MSEWRSARHLVFVRHRARAGVVQRRQPSPFRREGLGSTVALLGWPRRQRPRAEALVGRRQNTLPLVFVHAAQNIVRTSTDNGATWSKPRLFPMSGEFGNNIIRTREGVLAISLDGASLVISRDNGQTWTETGASAARWN